MRGICFIGAGKMATAIAGGMVRKNIKTEIHTFDPLPAAAEQFCRTCAGKAFPSPAAALEDTDAVLLAVKPQYLTGAVEAIRDAIGGRLVISIVAGATIAALEALTGTKRIVRVMPNTPALVGEGMSCIAASPSVSEEDLAEAETLLSAVGLCRRVGENQLDAVTGLSGSGPAFVLEFIQALADGGVYAGLPRATAIDGELRDAVISPAGTTSRGVMALAEGAFAAAVARAVVSAADRSAELGALAAKQ